mgnify:FL=1
MFSHINRLKLLRTRLNSLRLRAKMVILGYFEGFSRLNVDIFIKRQSIPSNMQTFNGRSKGQGESPDLESLSFPESPNLSWIPEWARIQLPECVVDAYSKFEWKRLRNPTRRNPFAIPKSFDVIDNKHIVLLNGMILKRSN